MSNTFKIHKYFHYFFSEKYFGNLTEIFTTKKNFIFR